MHAFMVRNWSAAGAEAILVEHKWPYVPGTPVFQNVYLSSALYVLHISSYADALSTLECFG